MTGRPGPVVLDVPYDVFMESAAEEAPNANDWNGNILSRCGADPEGVVKAVDMLLGAERPVIFVGQAIRHGGAATELLKLAERLQISVAASMSGLGAIDTRHPLSLGLVARGGHYQANHAARQADVLLALGVRFDDRTSSSWIPGYSFTIPPTKLIHVDIDPEEIGRNYPVALGLMADVRTFLRQIHAELDRRADLNQRADARLRQLGAHARGLVVIPGVNGAVLVLPSGLDPHGHVVLAVHPDALRAFHLKLIPAAAEHRRTSGVDHVDLAAAPPGGTVGVHLGRHFHGHGAPHPRHLSGSGYGHSETCQPEQELEHVRC
jgi:hypothetical protein